MSINRFFNLKPLVRKYLLCSVILLPFFVVIIKVAGLRKVMIFLQWLLKIHLPHVSIISDADAMYAVQQAVRIVQRQSPVKGNCLSRSVLMWFLLATTGIESKIRIGTRLNKAKFEAHAWLEKAGTILNDAPDIHQHFTVFESYPLHR